MEHFEELIIYIYIYLYIYIFRAQGSEKEALLLSIRAVIRCYVEEFPKQSMWKSQLQRVEHVLASEINL